MSQINITSTTIYQANFSVEAEFRGKIYDISCNVDIQAGEIDDMTDVTGQEIPDQLYDEVKEKLLAAEIEYHLIKP